MEVLLQKTTANLYFSRHNGGTKPIRDLQVNEARRRPCRRQLEASRTALSIHELDNSVPDVSHLSPWRWPCRPAASDFAVMLSCTPLALALPYPHMAYIYTPW